MQKWVKLYFKGMAMGAADVVPGVSGGTVAFMTGIYKELVTTLASLSPSLLKILFKEGFAATWQRINATFLAVLGAGIVTSIVLFANIIKSLLAHYPTLIWSLFFGLIIAAAIILLKSVTHWRASYIFLIALGGGISFGITKLSPHTMQFAGGADYLWLLPLGAIACCAMILPGISGSFLLLLMGMYQPLLEAVADRNLLFLATFSVGGASGIILFSRLLKGLLAHWYSPTLAFLVGVMLGALDKIWPFKDADGLSILPENLAEATSSSLLLLLGFFVAIYIGSQNKGTSKES